MLGGGIYIGRWHGDARAFVKRFKRELAELPVALFALGPLDEQQKHWADTEKVFRAAVAKLPVEPIETRLFGALSSQQAAVPAQPHACGRRARLGGGGRVGRRARYEPGGRSTANWSVISSSRGAKP